MGSNKGIDIDNNKILDSKEALNMVESFFSTKLPLFKPLKRYCNDFGHWGVEVEYQNCLVFICSDRGFLEVEIKISEKPILLTDFDPQFSLIENSSKNNILYLLKLIETLYNLPNSPFRN